MDSDWRNWLKMTPAKSVRALATRYRRAREFEVFSSADYWETRYATGGNSGVGSYGYLADFKAAVINGLVQHHGIQTVVEHGSGDGNQLKLLRAPRYLGLDVSRTAIDHLQALFKDDATKEFRLLSDASHIGRHEMAMSLDVIFHLVQDDVYRKYMERLFSSATKLVVIYSSDSAADDSGVHVRHRRFTPYVRRHFPDWYLQCHMVSPFKPASIADFYIYQRSQDRHRS